MGAPDAFFFTAAGQAAAWQRERLIRPDQSVYEIQEASTTMRPRERAAARRATGIDGDPALLWVGRLNDNKSPLTVLDGFERSLGRLPQATLMMIYGSDDLLSSVRARLESSVELAGRVRLAGTVPHDRMPLYYSGADLFVLGSHHEAMGYALIEACACGLPPVVTDIPAFRVTTANGTVGALWPPDDADGFARALVSVAERNRDAQRQQVLAHFDRALSWTAVARRASLAYEEIVERRAGR